MGCLHDYFYFFFSNFYFFSSSSRAVPPTTDPFYWSTFCFVCAEAHLIAFLVSPELFCFLQSAIKPQQQQQLCWCLIFSRGDCSTLEYSIASSAPSTHTHTWIADWLIDWLADRSNGAPLYLIKSWAELNWTYFAARLFFSSSLCWLWLACCWAHVIRSAEANK